MHVEVDCQTLTGSALDMGRELGYVKWGPGGIPEHKTLIKHQQCNDLHSYLDSSKLHPIAAQILAVHVLTHESMHMSGITSEAIAECDAMQRDTTMAEDLGAPPAAAHALAGDVLADGVSEHAGRVPQHRLPGRAGRWICTCRTLPGRSRVD